MIVDGIEYTRELRRCPAGRRHRWKRIAVRGSGTATVTTEVCAHCGAQRITEHDSLRPACRRRRVRYCY